MFNTRSTVKVTSKRNTSHEITTAIPIANVKRHLLSGENMAKMQLKKPQRQKICQRRTIDFPFQGLLKYYCIVMITSHLFHLDRHFQTDSLRRVQYKTESRLIYSQVCGVREDFYQRLHYLTSPQWLFIKMDSDLSFFTDLFKTCFTKCGNTGILKQKRGHERTDSTNKGN